MCADLNETKILSFEEKIENVKSCFLISNIRCDNVKLWVQERCLEILFNKKTYVIREVSITSQCQQYLGFKINTISSPEFVRGIALLLWVFLCEYRCCEKLIPMCLPSIYWIQCNNLNFLNFLQWQTNAILIDKLLYCSYMFRHYCVILRELVVSTLLLVLICHCTV